MIELLAAVPSIVYGMWGLLVFAPVFSQYVQPLLSNTLGNVPLLGGLFSGPPLGIGLLAAGIILAFMIIPFIAAVMRDVFDTTPPVAEGVGVQRRRHHVGSGVERGAALHQGRCRRRHHARPGACTGRDDGGDLRHRQHQRLSEISPS